MPSERKKKGNTQSLQKIVEQISLHYAERGQQKNKPRILKGDDGTKILLYAAYHIMVNEAFSYNKIMVKQFYKIHIVGSISVWIHRTRQRIKLNSTQFVMYLE